MSKNFEPSCEYNEQNFKNFLNQKVGNAVAVKTSWQLVEPDSSIRVFNTSAEGMKKAILQGDWFDPEADYVKSETLSTDDIYTIEMLNNNDQTTSRFQLTAIHFLVKKSKHWDWICLLYTSPSPRDRTRSRMPSSA